MSKIVEWGTEGEIQGRFEGIKDVNDAIIAQPTSENQSTTYQVALSNWFMGGSEYGGFSTEFTYPKRLKLVDLLYVNTSFFSGKVRIHTNAPSYPNSSLGYLTAQFVDLEGNYYYVIFSQSNSPTTHFRINTLTIKDNTNNFNYYLDRYEDGVPNNASGSYAYSSSNWNSSGAEYGAVVNGSFARANTNVVGLITFRGGYTGGASVFYNAMGQYGYPNPNYGYLGILLQDKNTSQQFLAIISQYVNSFSISTFNLMGQNSFIHYQSSWSVGGLGGAIANPSSTDSGSTSYEGIKRNPSNLRESCAIAITYADNTTEEIPLSFCPEWVSIKDDCCDYSMLANLAQAAINKAMEILR